MPKKDKKAELQLASRDKAKLILNVADGTRGPISSKIDLLIRINDGAQKQLFADYKTGPSVTFSVPFDDNFEDNYTVLVTASGFRDAGFFPVTVSPAFDTTIDLMLVPKKAGYRFLDWSAFSAGYPRLASFLACDGDEVEARTHYEDLMDNKQPALASLLNLTAAMSVINLPVGTPLDYFKEIEWDDSLAQDRFFGFADQAIVQQVRTAVAQGEFVPEPAPSLFHGDATSSFKQVQFGEANVQLTFHENTTKKIGGVQCIRVEPDIDYYQDVAAHTLLEVIPNALSHGLTDPQMVYVLRWIAGRHAGIPEFDPSYVLE
jgi:hypothetical protein